MKTELRKGPLLKFLFNFSRMMSPLTLFNSIHLWSVSFQINFAPLFGRFLCEEKLNSVPCEMSQFLLCKWVMVFKVEKWYWISSLYLLRKVCGPTLGCYEGDHHDYKIILSVPISGRKVDIYKEVKKGGQAWLTIT